VNLFQKKGKGISILVPYFNDSEVNARALSWKWLRAYLEANLPGAEIIVGSDFGVPFSKSVAVNEAAAKAKGDVFVILDADAFLEAATILDCAQQIREARSKKQKLWFVPYRRLYRLTEQATNRVLARSPELVTGCPEPCDGSGVILIDARTDATKEAHWYGAMAQILPREAFQAVGGWDTRFRGWGGEDVAAMLATDTLYAKHKTAKAALFHLWHPMLDQDGASMNLVPWNQRVWEGQKSSGVNNDLAGRYSGAYGDPTWMRKIVQEAKSPLALALAKVSAAVKAATKAPAAATPPNATSGHCPVPPNAVGHKHSC
jgi:N-terminal domain of galactosyltransferase